MSARCTTEGCSSHACIHDADNASVYVCIRCAANTGLVPKTRTGASMACSLCFDELEAELGITIGWRVRYDEDRTSHGKEKYGLVPQNPLLHPDGFEEALRTMWEYLGDWYHGFPPWHPKHETHVFRGKWGPALYKESMDRMRLFRKQGFRVRYVWESDWLAAKRANGSAADVVRELP